MAVDHRRLIWPRKEIRPIFLRFSDKFYFTKSCQQIWVRVNQPFIPFIYHIRGEKVLWGTVFIIQTSDRMQYFTILWYKSHSFNIQDNQSRRGLFSKPLKEFPRSPIWPAGSHFCSASCGRVFEWTLIELRSNIIKNLLCLFNGLTRGILSTPASDVHWTTENNRHSD